MYMVSCGLFYQESRTLEWLGTVWRERLLDGGTSKEGGGYGAKGEQDCNILNGLTAIVFSQLIYRTALCSDALVDNSDAFPDANLPLWRNTDRMGAKHSMPLPFRSFNFLIHLAGRALGGLSLGFGAAFAF